MSVRELRSFLSGEWRSGAGPEQILRDATSGGPVACFRSGGHDIGAALAWGRTRGGPALRRLTFRARGELVASLATALRDVRPELLEIARTYGATAADARRDVDGGLFTLAYYGRLGAKALPEAGFLLDGAVEPLSRKGGFAGRHILVPRHGIAVQINAYNFPCWGPLEKLGPALLAGVPSLVKPATRAALLTCHLVEAIVESGILPNGSISLLVGSGADLLDHLESQDAVLFTGSAETGRAIRSHPRVVAEAVRVNVEADSLNASVLGPDAAPGTPVRAAFLREIRSEMSAKAGQKCTAIRRALVPESEVDSIAAEVRGVVEELRVGAPSDPETDVGPLVDPDAVRAARDGLTELLAEADVIAGDPDAPLPAGAFFPPLALRLRDGGAAARVNSVEVFGPLVTLMPYRSADEAAAICAAGGGSLVTSVFSNDAAFLAEVTTAIAPWNGRVMTVSGRALAEHSGHGVAVPQLLHGGPGRAGGGEELGGLRALHPFLNRCAVQGDPETLRELFPDGAA